MISKNENVKIFLIILLAFSFSIIARLYWPITNFDVEYYVLNNQFILTTNDAFFWAEGAKDLATNSSTFTDRSPLYSGMALLTALIYKITPFSIETLLVYIPIVFSSLIVIPIILIGKKLDNISLGFIAALLAAVAHSYYNRTIAGYFDTDLLNIVFPMFLIWSLISSIKTKANKFIILTAVEIILYRFWYPQSYALEFSFLAIVLVITMYEYYKNKEYKYNLALISFILLSMMDMQIVLRTILVLGLFFVLVYKKEFFYRYLKYIFVFSVVLFIFYGGLNPIIGKLQGYLLRDIKISENLGLHFHAVMATINEVQPISFKEMGVRISGNFIVFLLSLIGYVLLLYRYKILILTLPMLGLGFLSMFAGLRFTMYAVPVVALGTAYLIVILSNFLANKFDSNFKNIVRNYSLIVFTIIVLIPNLNHIKSYKAFSAIDSQSAQNLSNLNEITTHKDYTISWWSYGYATRYYSNTNVLIDGGKHSGIDNFATSYIMSIDSQEKANNMSKLAVYYDLLEKEKNLDKNYIPDGKNIVERMILDYKYNNSNEFLKDINKHKVRDIEEEIYLFMPAKMLLAFEIIIKFSNLDLMTGKDLVDYVYYGSRSSTQNENEIILDGKMKIDTKSFTFKLENKLHSIDKFIKVKYDENDKQVINIEQKNQKGDVNLFYMEKFNIYLIVDKKLMNSLFVQLFIFENYDKRYFEPIALTPMSKIYKVVK